MLVLTAAALMALVLVVMATPAFATKQYAPAEGNCGENGSSLRPVVNTDFITFPNINSGGNLQGLQLHSCPANSPVGQR
jgi:hypothetical protein